MVRRKKKGTWQYYLLTTTVMISVFFLTLFALQTKTNHSVTNTQPVITEEEKKQFFKEIAPFAQKNQQIYGILSSITLAQAALESNFGRSQLASQYYNLFGIKGTSHDGVLFQTSEYLNNQWVQINDYFRQYPNWETSVLDHGQLLVQGTTWNALQYKDVVTATHYKQAAKGLVTGGYATDPAYADKIIQLIETYQLTQYDVDE